MPCQGGGAGCSKVAVAVLLREGKGEGGEEEGEGGGGERLFSRLLLRLAMLVFGNRPVRPPLASPRTKFREPRKAFSSPPVAAGGGI